LKQSLIEANQFNCPTDSKIEKSLTAASPTAIRGRRELSFEAAQTSGVWPFCISQYIVSRYGQMETARTLAFEGET